MTFQEAVRKLDELGGERYHCIQYELTTDRSGKKKQTCKLYLTDIDPDGSGFWTKEHTTWEAAFSELISRINYVSREAVPEEAPI